MPTISWTLRPLLADAGLPDVDPVEFPDVPVAGLTEDSHEVQPGACFAAIEGTHQDGHRFIPQAVRAGASVILAHRPVSVPPGVVLLRVSDVRDALARLAAAYFGVNRCQGGNRLRLIGVTGTNGKSTTCRILQSILDAAGHRTATIGTLGYDWVMGTTPAHMTTPPPVELCRYLAQARQAGASYAVMEVSSHALDQRRCAGLGFDAAVFTNLTGDHFDYHHDRENYLRAKKRLFDGLEPDAAAIINDDDPAADDMVADCPAAVLRYGLSNPRLDLTAEIRAMSLSGSTLELFFGGRSVSVRSPLIGRHNAANVLAAAGVAVKLGIRTDDLVRGIEEVGEVRGRLQRVEPEGCPVSVLVDYAHTDDALENALAAVRPLTVGRLICVFGCGGDRDRQKRPRMGAVAGRLADIVFVTSDNPRTEVPEAIINDILPGLHSAAAAPVHIEPDRRAAIYQAVALADAGDTVLIAGKGHEDYQILGGETIHFDDAEVAREALDKFAVTAHPAPGTDRP